VPTNIAYVTDADTQVTDTAAVGAAVARLSGLLLVAPDAESGAVAPQLDALGLSDRLDRMVVQPYDPPDGRTGTQDDRSGP
jgi:hypothetical protein